MPTRFEAMWLGELARQTYEDGSSFEHSTHYHESACELAVAYVLLSRANAGEVPGWVMQRTRRMLQFQLDIVAGTNAPLRIGDAIEDGFFPLDTVDGWGTAVWGEVYRQMFAARLRSLSLDDPTIERAFWLLGGQLAAPAVEPSSEDRPSIYPQGGFFAMRDSNADARLIFRTGPAASRLLMAGHVHADLLSVYLTISTVAVFVDAGTYTYRLHGAPSWREYLTGSAAHNGLSIAGEDPMGHLEGDFRSDDIQARVKITRQFTEESLAWIEGAIASTNSYDRHRRGVVHVFGEHWVVYDYCPLTVPLERASFGFQLAPEARIEHGGERIARVRVAGQQLCLAASTGLLGPEITRGRSEPLSGWVSYRYGQLTPASQLRFRPDGSSPITAFLLRPGPWSGDKPKVEVHPLPRHGVALRITCGDVVDQMILVNDTTEEALEAWGVQFDGAFLWLRAVREMPVALRALEARRISSDRFGVGVRSNEPVKILEIGATPEGIIVAHGSRDDLRIAWRED